MAGPSGTFRGGSASAGITILLPKITAAAFPLFIELDAMFALKLRHGLICGHFSGWHGL